MTLFTRFYAILYPAQGLYFLAPKIIAKFQSLNHPNNGGKHRSGILKSAIFDEYFPISKKLQDRDIVTTEG